MVQQIRGSTGSKLPSRSHSENLSPTLHVFERDGSLLDAVNQVATKGYSSPSITISNIKSLGPFGGCDDRNRKISIVRV